MNSANIEMLGRAATILARLPDQVVYVGGATIELWSTDPAQPKFRPTKDVDVVVEIATRVAYYAFEGRLRAVGFVNGPDGGVICRFRYPGLDFLLDAIPTEASVLGFENRWQKRRSRMPPRFACPLAPRSALSRRPTCLPPGRRSSAKCRWRLPN